MPPRVGVGPSRRAAPDGVEDGRGGVEIHRVAELVALRRAAGFDAGRQVARVVTAGAAVADRAEQIAQRLEAEKVERLVGDLEGHAVRWRRPAAALRAALPFALEIGRRRDVARFLHPLDDLLDQLLELLPHLLLIAVGRIAEQLFEHVGRQHAAAEERLENRVVQRLHRPVVSRRTDRPTGCRTRSTAAGPTASTSARPCRARRAARGRISSTCSACGSTVSPP